jgi:hypothetical protein
MSTSDDSHRNAIAASVVGLAATRSNLRHHKRGTDTVMFGRVAAGMTANDYLLSIFGCVQAWLPTFAVSG